MYTHPLEISHFCKAIIRDNITFLCNTGYGYVIKMPTVCWHTINSYVSEYSIEEIVNAADEADREYYYKLFSNLIEKRFLVKKGSRTITSIDFIITNRCNLRCKHCCSDACGVNGKDPLTTSDVLRIINEIIKLNPESIVINGGEPMLRKDFFEICQYLRLNYSGNISLMTNGTLITPDNVKTLISLFGGINISLDGYDEETCSKIRGAGVFGKVIKAVEILKQNGMPANRIALSMVETVYTTAHVSRFESLCEELGVGCMVREFSPTGRGAENKAEFDINLDAVIVPNASSPSFIEEPTICRACRAGFEKFSISHEGKVFPCPILDSQEYCLGDYRKVNSLSQHIDSKAYMQSDGFKAFEKLLPSKREKCADCEASPFCVFCYADFSRRIDDKDFDMMCSMKKHTIMSEYGWKE